MLQTQFSPQFPLARPILKLGDPRLQQECEPVSDFASALKVVDQLRDTLEKVKTQYDFTRGCGISAPQIGELLRICLVEYEGKSYTLINPTIIRHSETTSLMREGCMSYFDRRANVKRYDMVEVSALDENGNFFTLEGEGDFSSLLLHELDHLDGILTVDHLENGEADLFVVESPKLQ